MLARIFILFNFMLCFIISYSQSQILSIKQHGTYLISCITKDGIVAGADSRESCLDQAGNVYTYCEGYQKLFVHNGVIIQMSGSYDFDKYTFSGLLKAFEKKNKENTTVRNWLSLFLKFSKTKISAKTFSDIKNNQWIISGYFKSIPHIYFVNKGVIDSAVGKGYKTNNSPDNNNADIRTAIEKYNSNDIIEFVKRAIKGIAESPNNRKNPLIGGPVSVVYINVKGLQYQDIQNKYSYLTVHDQMMAEWNNEIKRVYRSQRDSFAYRYSLYNFLFAHKSDK
jgi:hypothetical protein